MAEFPNCTLLAPWSRACDSIFLLRNLLNVQRPYLFAWVQKSEITCAHSLAPCRCAVGVCQQVLLLLVVVEVVIMVVTESPNTHACLPQCSQGTSCSRVSNKVATRSYEALKVAHLD